MEMMRNRQGRSCDERSIIFFRFCLRKKRNGNLKKFENWESRIGHNGLVYLGKEPLATLGKVLNAISNDSKDTIKEHCSTVLCPFPEE